MKPVQRKGLALVDNGREAAPIGCGLFGFSQFEVSLAGVGRLAGIHAGSQTGFFEEIAPAFVGIGWTLTVLIFAHGSFGVLASLDNFDYAGGHVGANVVADEDVGRLRVIECQRGSVFGLRWEQ
jgi:hypothetical protein